MNIAFKKNQFAAALLIVFGLSMLGASDDPSMGEEEIVEVADVEIIETVQVLETERSDTGESRFSIATIYGRLHPAFVHLPIGFLVLLLIFDVIAFLRTGNDLQKAGFIALAATFLATLPSTLSGFVRASEMWSATRIIPELVAHRNIMLAMTGMLTLALVLRFLKKNKIKGGLRYVYLLLILGATVLAMIGGHMGGKMVFGDHHLPF